MEKAKPRNPAVLLNGSYASFSQLTLRDVLAVAAMIPLVHHEYIPEHIGKMAYQIADEMLKARENETKK